MVENYEEQKEDGGRKTEDGGKKTGQRSSFRQVLSIFRIFVQGEIPVEGMQAPAAGLTGLLGNIFLELILRNRGKKALLWVVFYKQMGFCLIVW